MMLVTKLLIALSVPAVNHIVITEIVVTTAGIKPRLFSFELIFVKILGTPQ